MFPPPDTPLPHQGGVFRLPAGRNGQRPVKFVGLLGQFEVPVGINANGLGGKRRAAAGIEELNIVALHRAQMKQGSGLPVPGIEVNDVSSGGRAGAHKCLRAGCEGAVTRQDGPQPVPVYPLHEPAQMNHLAGTLKLHRLAPMAELVIDADGVDAVKRRLSYVVRAPVEPNVDGAIAVAAESGKE